MFLTSFNLKNLLLPADTYLCVSNQECQRVYNHYVFEECHQYCHCDCVVIKQLDSLYLCSKLQFTYRTVEPYTNIIDTSHFVI